MRLVFLSFFILLCSALLKAQPENLSLYPDAEISLLTVHPRNKAVYAIFGHTALRIHSPSQGFDVVYNYGYFDSSKPFFLYRFVKGETDYILGIDEFDFFIYKYALDKSTVEEQRLNLSADEKEQLFFFLNNNAKEENREYRYNYFFDNCTTRPRDIIENLCAGQLSYGRAKESGTTLRKLTQECTEPYPWLQLGIDMVLGSGADSIVGYRTELFLPVKLMQAYDEAFLLTDSLPLPLVSKRQILLETTEGVSAKNGLAFSRLLHPNVLAPVLFICLLVFTFLAHHKRRLYAGIDFALFGLFALGGVIVAFISLVSTHPCTSYNYNLVWIHPFHLLALLPLVVKSSEKFTLSYHLINFALLSVFLLVWYFIPQEISKLIIWFVLSLWLRSGYNLFYYRARKKERARK